MADKTITVIVGSDGPSAKKFVSKLVEYSDLEVRLRKYSDIAVIIEKNKVKCIYVDDGSDVADVDAIYLRGNSNEHLRNVIAIYLQNKDIPVINSESYTFQNISKIVQYVKLAVAGVPVPDTLYMTEAANYPKGLKYFDGLFPMVVKSIVGKNGRENELVANLSELKQTAINNAVIQPFIKNDFDYRVIVAGDDVILAYKRVRGRDSKTYKNNISRGGERIIVDNLPNDLQKMAIAAAKSLNREFCGLDIVTDSESGMSAILEANFNFGTPNLEDKELEQQYYQAISHYFSSYMNQLGR